MRESTFLTFGLEFVATGSEMFVMSAVSRLTVLSSKGEVLLSIREFQNI